MRHHFLVQPRDELEKMREKCGAITRSMDPGAALSVRRKLLHGIGLFLAAKLLYQTDAESVIIHIWRLAILMAHYIRGYISAKQNLLRIPEAYPEAIVVDMNQGMGLLPLTRPLAFNLSERFQAPTTCSEEVFEGSTLNAAEIRFGQFISHSSPTAYIETEFHGGTGTQYAVAWNNDVEICGLLMSSNEPPIRTDRSIEAINSALRAIGVKSEKGHDEFDSIGLQYYRYAEEFEPPDGQYLNPMYFQTCLIKYPLAQPPKNRLKQLFKFFIRGR
ncbi:MAG: hypothetical protein IPK83_24375 [Planctomycetes bacterium]|nr:hypothetical protein [Planctomycetota bacterium]